MIKEKTKDRIAEFFGNTFAYHLMANKSFWRYLMRGKMK